ncbi:MAG: 3-methyladenine DNA glycosylase [Porticoccaceae bacterium]|nr:3-methyladenine DNA glycosylase [Porticoccaceae bacterium]|tara:strand:- start:206 stop:898 length:693 start_codon:yes stop_codon:yes gene_type:complete
MSDFNPILSRALFRKGSEEALAQWILEPLPSEDFLRIPNNRFLSNMTRCVFQAGFVWSIIQKKWPDFESIFFGFEPLPITLLSPDQLERIASDKRIVRNRQKVQSVPLNASYILDMSSLYGNFATFIYHWSEDDFTGLCTHLKQHGSRLGGRSGPRMLRYMGKDSFNLSRDVITCLRQSGLEIADHPNSKKDLKKIQTQFNNWRDQTGFSLTKLSRICACSCGENHSEPR